MDIRPGLRVRARGLIWDVLETEADAGRARLLLRCAEGDLAGLEWTLFVPPETIEPAAAQYDPDHPAPLSLWRLTHRAHLLNAIPFPAPIAATQPGRLRVEPYQLVPLMRALDMPRVRLLLADGVGLGKTVQACLIAAETIARRRAHRILIVAPSGPLLAQWEQETRLRFGLRFTTIASAADLRAVRRAHELGANPFESVSLCLAALDFAKQDHVLEELERAAWDLVIIDEAHHCADLTGTGETTHRRRLAEVLARRSDGLLLLTATPHDGHDAHFASLIALLDPSLTDGAGGFNGDLYRRHTIRRLKSHIRDPRTGAPLFRPRKVTPVKVDVEGDEHEPVRAFHRALADFVVPRLRRHEDGLAFVTLLKRSVSTIASCLATLRVVIARMEADPPAKGARAERARALRAWRRRTARFGTLPPADEASEEAMEIESMAETLREEHDTEASRLIALGLAAQAADPKLAALLLEIRLIRAAEPDANIIVYTEYGASQAAAAEMLRSAAVGEIVTIGGQDPDEQRQAAAAQFGTEKNLILISTDSTSEGLNLHRHCHHLIHLDLPYNPNRLEQRNGRIDRYGQTSDPDIRYLYLPGTFEERLLLHLIAKYEKARAFLDIMPDTLGVTAAGDSLTRGLSEDPQDLFGGRPDPIHTLDRAAEHTDPESVAALLREIDRAYADFDLMAVAHGWFAGPGINAVGPETVPVETRTEDLADFTAAVIAAETGNPAGDPLILPPSWRHGLDRLPGLDPESGVLRLSGGIDIDPDSAFLGRAHPVTLRAIRAGCRLPAKAAAARGETLGLLRTYEIEIAAGPRVVLRRVAAVMTHPDGRAREVPSFLALASDEPAVPTDGLWARHFASWANAASADSLVQEAASRDLADILDKWDNMRAQETQRWQTWLRLKTNQCCGVFVPTTEDLFGAADTRPEWERTEDPLTRLTALATHPDTSAPRRREANAAIAMVDAATNNAAQPGTPVVRPLGLLMLVPDDVR